MRHNHSDSLSAMHFSLSSLRIAACTMALSVICACSSVDDDRIPPANVNLIFSTVGDWDTYGVSGAGQYRIFIASQRIPSGFPYKGSEGTGYGGLLLLMDPMGQPLVFDLACPFCAPQLQRISVDSDATEAGIFRCGKCGSTYDVYAAGTPRYGPALKEKYGLQRYRISIPGTSPYAVIGR